VVGCCLSLIFANGREAAHDTGAWETIVRLDFILRHTHRGGLGTVSSHPDVKISPLRIRALTMRLYPSLGHLKATGTTTVHCVRLQQILFCGSVSARRMGRARLLRKWHVEIEIVKDMARAEVELLSRTNKIDLKIISQVFIGISVEMNRIQHAGHILRAGHWDREWWQAGVTSMR